MSNKEMPMLFELINDKNVKLIQNLLESKPDLASEVFQEQTPLTKLLKMKTKFKENPQLRMDIFEEILKYAKVNQEVGDLKDTALHISIRREDVEGFVALVNARHINLNAQNEHGETPLHIATHKNKWDFVYALAYTLKHEREQFVDYELTDMNNKRPDEHGLESGIWLGKLRNAGSNSKLLEEVKKKFGGTVILNDNKEQYEMNAVPRGLCIIINNKSFQNPELLDRTGTNFDRDRLKKLFEWLKFKVIEKENLTGNEIAEVFCNLKKNKVTEGSDCLVVCILSHGKNGAIYGVDGVLIQKKWLKESLTPNWLPKLQNKPKLFFIQACRGVKDLKVYHRDSATTDSTNQDSLDVSAKKNEPVEHEEKEIMNEGNGGKSPTSPLADIYMAEATPEGYSAYRQDEGSPFIQILCDVFEEHAHNKSLHEMMLKVKQGMVEENIKIKGKSIKPVADISLDTLLYEIFFSPGETFQEYKKARNP